MRAGRRQRSGGGDDGFVLVAVLGLLLILALIVASLSLSTRTQVKLRGAAATRAELSVLADGIVTLAAVRAGAQQTLTGAPAAAFDGTSTWCRDGEIAVRVEVTDVAGLIDLNLASPEVLAIIFAGVGMPVDAATKLAAAVADFRDADDTPRVGGAEARDYAAAGRGFAPKNAAFDSVDELDQVLGMTPEVLAAVRPLLTVHSRAPALDLASAPLSLLQVLRRGDPAGGASDLVERERFQAPRQLPTRQGGRAAARSPRRTFSIVATVGRSGAAFARAAIVEIAPQTTTGLQVHEWTAPPATTHLAPPVGLPACF